MACGVPVVASAVGKNHELVRDNVNGYLATSMSDWVERLATLIEDPHLRAAMGREGRAFIERNYDVRLFVPTLAGVLRRASS
jgi:glycosyltransferase involved in cell wall biosynthesis